MTLKHGKGWVVDFPDFRDYTPKTEKVQMLLGTPLKQVIPPAIDNRKWCSPVRNQGQIGSCTAHAAVGMYEYMENQAHGKHLEGSELFVYKNTRMLMATRGELSTNGEGDTGATIRAALGSLAYCGVAPEESYPYVEELYDQIPNNFVYALAQSYQIEQYLRLDFEISNPKANLDRIKEWLAKGFPVMCGFTCYKDVLRQAETTGGHLAFPGQNDIAEGGHAIMICGYNDNHVSGGAFLIKNSWGPEWGEGGYGWLDYNYVLSGHGLAQDFWSVLKVEWIDKSQFHF